MSLKDSRLNPDFTPFDHQVSGVTFAKKHRYSINCDEPGLGKTLQAVALANALKANTLVICPAYLKLNWSDEINTLCGDQKNVMMFPGSQALHVYRGAEDLEDFIIINYEQIEHAEYLFKWADLIVVDEAHALKSDTARRSILFDDFLFEAEVPRLLLMTGTPIPNRVEELYALLSYISYDPSITGETILDRFPTKESFCEHFSHPKVVQIKTRRGRINKIVYEGVKNVEELRAYLKPKMIRRLQKDVLDLPKIVSKEVMVSYKENTKLLKEFESHNEDTKKDMGSSAKVKSAVVKSKFTAKYAQDLLDSDEQVVVYSAHRPSATIIADELRAKFATRRRASHPEDKNPEAWAKTQVAYIDGSTPIKERDRIKKAFQAGEIQAISATIGAASTGITLHAACHLIFNDLDWSPGNNDQALRRIYRIGQKRVCFIHYIYGSPQDRYLGRKLADKMETINAVLG